MSHNVTGRDGLIITQALTFAYAAMKHLPKILQPRSNMEDMRRILFDRLGRERAEFVLGQALLNAWNLRADVPSTIAIDERRLHENLRAIRQQVLAEPPGDPDIPLIVAATRDSVQSPAGSTSSVSTDAPLIRNRNTQPSRAWIR